MPELKYSEETFRAMYEALKAIFRGSDIRNGELGLLHCPSRESMSLALKALAKAEEK